MNKSGLNVVDIKVPYTLFLNSAIMIWRGFSAMLRLNSHSVKSKRY